MSTICFILTSVVSVEVPLTLISKLAKIGAFCSRLNKEIPAPTTVIQE